MKITPSRFEIRESVVFCDLSRSPKPFFGCQKLELSIFLEIKIFAGGDFQEKWNILTLCTRKTA